MKLTKKQVKHVAELARLDLSDKEIEKFRKQLSSILEYVELLDEVDTSDVKPTGQTTGLVNVTREDRPRKEQCLTQKEALSNAPDSENGFIKTRPVL